MLSKFLKIYSNVEWYKLILCIGLLSVLILSLERRFSAVSPAIWLLFFLGIFLLTLFIASRKEIRSISTFGTWLSPKMTQGEDMRCSVQSKIATTMCGLEQMDLDQNKAEISSKVEVFPVALQDIPEIAKLTAESLNMVETTLLIQRVKSQLEAITLTDAGTKKEISQILKMIEEKSKIDRVWEDYRKVFELSHPHLANQLKMRFPTLTQSELKICSLTRQNLSGKEIANLLNITTDSIKTTRCRIRKKLGLQKEHRLFDFLLGIENQGIIRDTVS